MNCPVIQISNEQIRLILERFEQDQEKKYQLEDYVLFEIEPQLPPTLSKLDRLEYLGAASCLIWVQYRHDHPKRFFRVWRQSGSGSFSSKRYD